jgi:hypothetical protein
MLALALATLLLAPLGSSAPRAIRAQLESEERALLGELTGAVFDDAGRPVRGASLTLRVRDGERGWLVLGRARSAADGRFALQRAEAPRGLDRDGAQLTIHAPPLAPTVVEHVFLLQDGYELGAFTLHTPVELRGEVRDESGAPIAGAHIFAVVGPVAAESPEHWGSAPLATTDENGRYSLRALPPGPVTVSVAAPGFADVRSHQLSLVAGSPHARDFTLQRERVVELRVTAPDGAPVADFEVAPPGDAEGDAPRYWYWSFHTFWRAPQRGDERGIVRIAGVAADARLDVRVRANGFREAFVPLRGVDLTLRLEPVTWIEVSAVRAPGEPQPVLNLVKVRDGAWPAQRDDLGEDDSWRVFDARSTNVEVLSPSRWRIAWDSPESGEVRGPPERIEACVRDGGRCAAKLPPAQQHRVLCELAFAGTYRVEGRVVGPDESPAVARVHSHQSLNGFELGFSVETGPGGRFVFEALGNSTPFLTAVGDAGSSEPWWRRTEAEPGAIYSGIELRLIPHEPEASAPPSKIRVRVTLGGRRVEAPLLLALCGEAGRGSPFALLWTDADGRFEWTAPPRTIAFVVPRDPQANRRSGWIDFPAGFALMPEPWRNGVVTPDLGVSEVELALPEPKY